ncbi:MAG: DUF47 domain-containing protein [Verrucomicrobiales bacterium]
MKIFKKEKKVAELAMHYLGIVGACVASARECVDAFLDGDLEKADAARLKTSELESDADAARRDIGDTLHSGAYLPLIRGDIYSLIDSLDGVPNAAEACCGFLVGQRPEIPVDLKEQFSELAHATFDILNPLDKAVKRFFKSKGKIDEIRQRTKEVGVQETTIDRLEWDLTTALFSDESLDLAVKMHARRAISRIVELSDRAEDCAEQLELVAVKSVN